MATHKNDGAKRSITITVPANIYEKGEQLAADMGTSLAQVVVMAYYNFLEIECDDFNDGNWTKEPL
jgi:hypothetical protein